MSELHTLSIGEVVDAEDQYDDMEPFEQDEQLVCLEGNVPWLKKVTIYPHASNSADLHRLGAYIGRNTQLNTIRTYVRDEHHDDVRIEDLCPGEADIVNLFSGIAFNRSVKRYSICWCFDDYCAGYLGTIFSILALQFKTNQVEHLSLGHCDIEPQSLDILAETLEGFDSLKGFELASCTLEDGHEFRRLMRALSNHSGLKLVLRKTPLVMFERLALKDLLCDPKSDLEVLKIGRDRSLSDSQAAVLAWGISRSTKLKELYLDSNRVVTQAGWQAIFDAFKSPTCKLEKLSLSYVPVSLYENEINDATMMTLLGVLNSPNCKLKTLCLNGNSISDTAAQALANVLTTNTILKSLKIINIPNCTMAGWQSFFGALSSLTCSLENLAMGDNLSGGRFTHCTDALVNNMSLKSLDLSCIWEVTGKEWQTFFSTLLLGNLGCRLEKLGLRNNRIDDDAIRVLVDMLINNGRLTQLNLHGNHLVTNAGWESFSAVLESPHIALEKLDIGPTRGRAGEHYNDLEESDYPQSEATLASLINSLAGNKTLKTFIFGFESDWLLPLSFLCNNGSIMDTYNSNHTLSELGYYWLGSDHVLPEDFVSLLQINRGNNPSQAARIKIINTHFSEGFNVAPFIDMDLNVLPHALAWMSRGGVSGAVNGHFYEFIKSTYSRM